MQTRLPSIHQFALLAVSVGVGAGVASALSLTVEGERALPVIAVMAILLGLVLMAVLSGATRRQAPVARVNRWLRDRARRLDLGLTDRLFVSGTVPPATAGMSVAPRSGRCPLGFTSEDRWTVSPGGRLSPSACVPAANAMERLLQRREQGERAPASCVCPLGTYFLTFEVRDESESDERSPRTSAQPAGR